MAICLTGFQIVLSLIGINLALLSSTATASDCDYAEIVFDSKVNFFYLKEQQERQQLETALAAVGIHFNSESMNHVHVTRKYGEKFWSRINPFYFFLDLTSNGFRPDPRFQIIHNTGKFYRKTTAGLYNETGDELARLTKMRLMMSDGFGITKNDESEYQVQQRCSEKDL